MPENRNRPPQKVFPGYSRERSPLGKNLDDDTDDERFKLERLPSHRDSLVTVHDELLDDDLSSDDDTSAFKGDRNGSVPTDRSSSSMDVEPEYVQPVSGVYDSHQDGAADKQDNGDDVEGEMASSIDAYSNHFEVFPITHDSRNKALKRMQFVSRRRLLVYVNVLYGTGRLDLKSLASEICERYGLKKSIFQAVIQSKF